MKTTVKIFFIEFISFLVGGGVYSEDIENWCYSMRKKLHVEKAKADGKKFLVIVWESSELAYHFMPQKTEKDVDLCKQKYSWGGFCFVETVTI